MEEQLNLFPEFDIKQEIIKGDALDVSAVDIFFQGDTNMHKNANTTIGYLKTLPPNTYIAFKKDGDGFPYLKNQKTGRIIKARTSRGVYPAINLPRSRNMTVYCHRLFAILFLKNPDTKFYTEVNHSDEDKLNFRLENLEWITPSAHRKLTVQSTASKK